MEKIRIPGLKTAIKNPLEGADLYTYEGPIEGVDGFLHGTHGFKQQKENYEKLQLSLHEFGIQLNWIIVGVKSRHRGHSSFQFLANDETKQFFWRKYESDALGSGQNWIYVCGKKYKLTRWLDSTPNERYSILQQTNFIIPSEQE